MVIKISGETVFDSKRRDSRFKWWSGEALARSLQLAFMLGLYDAGNDNARRDDAKEID